MGVLKSGLLEENEEKKRYHYVYILQTSGQRDFSNFEKKTYIILERCRVSGVWTSV